MSSSSQDIRAEFMAQLLSRYDRGEQAALLSKHDMDCWTELVGTTRREAYNVMARDLAVGFSQHRFPFWFCDAVINAVVGFVYDDCFPTGVDLPTPFYDIYLAFDAGEVGRPGEDPVEAYTRPMIEKIVSTFASDAG